ncbi:MAG: hypothetical protein ABF876_05320 [Acetobacter aceti]
MNAPVKLTGFAGVIAILLECVPPQYALYVSLFVIACAGTAAIVPPPHAGSKWVLAYLVITKIGMNLGWAENHFKPGVSGVRVPRLDKPAAKQAVLSAGIPVLNKKGTPEMIPPPTKPTPTE